MSQIPRSYVDSLSHALNRLSKATQAVVKTQLESIVYTDIADLRRQVIEILDPLFEQSTDLAAAYAAESYDQIREESIGVPLGAEAVSNRKPAATEGAIRALIQRVVEGNFESFIIGILERVDYEIKKAAGEATLYNAYHDPLRPRYARVPTGSETCQFCIMLASRGFVYSSDKSAGVLDHWHANCDCRVVPGFPGMTVAGYDPEALRKEWKASGGEEAMARRRERERDQGKKRNRSEYAFAGDKSKGIPELKDFNAVKSYLYKAETAAELERRYNLLGSVYGMRSKQMNSQSLKNVVKTANKRLKQKK